MSVGSKAIRPSAIRPAPTPNISRAAANTSKANNTVKTIAAIRVRNMNGVRVVLEDKSFAPLKSEVAVSGRHAGKTAGDGWFLQVHPEEGQGKKTRDQGRIQEDITMLPLKVPGVNMERLVKGRRIGARHQNEL